MAYTFDYSGSQINVLSPQTVVDCQDLINAIRQEEASYVGIVSPTIALASGKESLGSGVSVGITIELLGNWKLSFWPGSYVAKVAGGNLVGGPGGDPIAYTAGVQVLLIQSAASTIVDSSGGIPSSSDNATAVWSALLTSNYSAEQLMRLMAAAMAGKVSGSPDGPIVIRDIEDTRNAIVAVVDDQANRSHVTVDV